MNEELFFVIGVTQPQSPCPIQFSADGIGTEDVPLSEAVQLLKQLRASRGDGFIVPSRYRHPLIDRNKARDIALTRLKTIRTETGRSIGELSEGRDDFLWWLFYADDHQAQAEERIPGAVFIAVDKLDGHIRTLAEYQAWGKLSALPTTA